ncbi:hypothetical protein HDE_10987 [Halotydeus destructor]|nr:hypothetical protein HDE_10987 [Halotydeus destructor]
MGTFITSFAVLGDLHLTKQVGAYMTSLYWFAYTFFRLLAIAFIDKIGIRQTIVLDLGILVVANIFLVPFANSVEWCLWVGIVLAGIGLSTIWASTYSLLESHFPVTSGAASFLCVSVCLGEWVYPVIMGYAFDDSAQLYLWFIFGCTVLCFLLFIMLCIALRAMVTGAQTPLKSTLANYGSVIIETGLKPERDADTRKISAAESNA